MASNSASWSRLSLHPPEFALHPLTREVRGGEKKRRGKKSKSDLFDLDGKLPLGEVCALLLLLLGDSAGVLGAQSAADGTGLLCAEVEWEILLLCVEDAELMALVGVDDGEGACDGFAEVVSVVLSMIVSVFFRIAHRFYASLFLVALRPLLSLSFRRFDGRGRWISHVHSRQFR